jgi:hypothetical protein
MTLERPMFPPSRRGFLALAVGAAATPATIAIGSPAMVLQGPYSPALVDASRALQDAHAALKAAKAVYDVAAAKAEAWERDNPQPRSRRGVKRWIRKARVVSDGFVRQPFVDMLEAERVFTAAQVALAKIPPADARDLMMMACHAVIYDEVSMTGWNQAPLSRVVAYHLLKQRLPGVNA